MRTLRIVSVSPDGPDTELGTVTLSGDTMVINPPEHGELFVRFLRNRSEPEVFNALFDGGGWSNGYISIVPAEAAATA